jgi:hypothetical protein
VVNGQIVWILPCDLDAGLPCFPKGADEGVACYLMRIVDRLAVFPAGEWTPLASYCKNSMVSRYGSLYIALSDNSGVTPETNPAVWELAVSGGWTAGINTDFVQPSCGGNVTIEVANSDAFDVGMSVFHANGGYYTVISIPDQNHIEIQNQCVPGFPLPGETVFNVGAILTTSGTQGGVGATGPQGLTGPKGDTPAHVWIGTGLQFQNPDGSWGSLIDLRGLTGATGPAGATGATGATGAAGPSIVAMDEGVILTHAMDVINFVGAGVTATNIGDAVTVNIPGGGGGSGYSGTFDVVVSVDWLSPDLTKTVRSLTYVNGLLTAVGAPTTTNITTAIACP